MSEDQSAHSEFWSNAAELPPLIFEAWRKPDLALSPVAVLATVDDNGAPRTAPFGSLRAVTPRLLRLCCLRDHATYANLLRDGRVMVALLSPPDLAVGVRGRARLVREHMHHDPRFAILEIDIEEVKNDMAYRIRIDTALAITPRPRFQSWYDAAMCELDSLGSG